MVSDLLKFQITNPKSQTISKFQFQMVKTPLTLPLSPEGRGKGVRRGTLNFVH
jgi:hypothetical protein